MAETIRETAISFNFKASFDKKLASIEPFDEKTGREIAQNYSRYGVTRILRNAVALVLPMKDSTDFSAIQLWIEDRAKVKNQLYPHNEAFSSLSNTVSGLPVSTAFDVYKGYIREDASGGVILEVSDFPTILGRTAKGVLELCKVYNVIQIIQGYKGLLEENTVAEVRENFDLLYKAREAGLTGLQTMRFRCLALSAKIAQVSVNHKDLITRIKQDDVKHDSL